MIYTSCRECGAQLIIDENDYMPGCRETEEVECPVCHKVATTVFTSGFPTAYLDKDGQGKEIARRF